VNRGEAAQQPNEPALLRFRKRGGRIGICGVHTILHCAVKLKHARQSTSSRLKDIPDSPTSPRPFRAPRRQRRRPRRRHHRQGHHSALPDWVHHAVVYQVYPQTFYDSNGDGIGDLPGIIAKLDYIKSLGVDAIWINPFFDSPFNDAGYDIRDYYKIAPRYGSNDDARRLFAEAHKRGLKVLFDYVISYTSIDNPWFVASSKQTPSPYSNWYIWTDNVWKTERGNQWVHGYGQRNGNFYSNFFWNEPALNYGYGTPDPPAIGNCRRIIPTCWRCARRCKR
jgi:hypothetical protein